MFWSLASTSALAALSIGPIAAADAAAAASRARFVGRSVSAAGGDGADSLKSWLSCWCASCCCLQTCSSSSRSSL
jgi:hypothetical protein